MHSQVLSFLKYYSKSPIKVDRLIVSSFLHSNSLVSKAKGFLEPFLILKSEDEYTDLVKFLDVVSFSNLEDLIEVFEFVVSPEDKVVTGAVYTPQNIREHIVNECFSLTKNLDNVKICDPACGCSSFLFTAARILHERTGMSFQRIFKENIFGLDIQEYSIRRSKILLALFSLYNDEDLKESDFNLYIGNALNFKWSEHLGDFEGFDIILGNPPYVCSRNIEKESLKYIYDWKVSSTGHPDLYIPFFQIGLENLKKKGVLGYITMNSFFKSINGRALRKYFEEEQFALSIFDFGSNQVFKSKSTYTCICIIQNTKVESIQYAEGSQNELVSRIVYKSIPYQSLRHQSGWNLRHTELLRKIEETGAPFGDLYKTRNGIATLKNNIYIFDPIDEDENFFYLQNGSLYPIEKSICKDIINPNRLISTRDLSGIKNKVIFPYRYNKSGAVSLMKEKDLSNNYPKAYSYLQAKKAALATRDKGARQYESWFAYGRNQSLEHYPYKLFFPHIAPSSPNFVPSTDKNLLFHNGLAAIAQNEDDLEFLKKILGSRLFWFYVVNSSKPYGSGYYSLSRNYIKAFGVYQFSDSEKEDIISYDQISVDSILEDLYGVKLK